MTEDIQPVPKVARRTLISAAAWSVPAVAVLTATPAFAVSQGTVTMSVTGFTTDDKVSLSNGYWISGQLKLKLTNVGNTSDALATVIVTFARVGALSGHVYETHAIEGSVTVPPNSEVVFSFNSKMHLNLGTWKVSYSVSATDSAGDDVLPGLLSGSVTQIVDIFG